MRYSCMWFFAKINYVKNTRYTASTSTTSAASVAAASGASCRGCQVTLLDFAAITAKDDRIPPRGPLCHHRRQLL